MLELFALYSRIYHALTHYRSNQAQKSQNERIPLMRAMFIQVDNKDVYNIQDQYYLGDDILVSPFMTQKNNRKYYLPKG